MQQRWKGRSSLPKFAHSRGASWVILQPPPERGVSEDFFVRFFGAVADRVELPVAIQNAPEYLGVGLTPAGVKMLAKNHPNFCILKAEGPALSIRQIIEETGDSVTVFNGRGGLELLDNLRAGCAGMIPACDTFDRQARIFDLLRDGAETDAEAVYREVLPAIVFVMQSLQTLHTYGKRIAAMRLGLMMSSIELPACGRTLSGCNARNAMPLHWGPWRDPAIHSRVHCRRHADIANRRIEAQSPEEWFRNGRAAVEKARQEKPIMGHARNVILFLGDGMGISTVTAARILEGQQRGMSGEDNQLAFEKLPYVALSKTYSANQQTSDSAPTMSAIMTGMKTNDGLISVTQRVARGDFRAVAANSAKTLLERAEDRGMATGVVTTTRITHATPAACYAHSPDRDWESDADQPDAANEAGFPDIAKQLIEFPHGDGLEVALGGGRGKFLPRSVRDPEYPDKTGERHDGRDLTREWQSRYSEVGLRLEQGAIRCHRHQAGQAFARAISAVAHAIRARSGQGRCR
jgi:hypothetical protein